MTPFLREVSGCRCAILAADAGHREGSCADAPATSSSCPERSLPMRGKNVLMESLIGPGVQYVFGNPGTTESPILDALLDYPQLRYVVALHEGVALGAASYYAQTSGTPAVVNVHVAPGLGNALGMLYNALKAGAPLLLTAGQHDQRLSFTEPLLWAD